MPLFDIIVLSVFIAMFVTFGAVLAAVCWYCSDKRKHASDGAARHYKYPNGNYLITDDD